VFQNCQGEGGGKQKLHVKDLMEQHPMLFCTVFNSWEQRLAVQMRLGFRKKKGTNIVLGIE